MLLGVGGYYHGGGFSGKALPPCPSPMKRVQQKGVSACCLPKEKAWKGKQICCGAKKKATAVKQDGGKFSLVCKPWVDPGGPGDVTEDPRDSNGGGGGDGGSIFDEGGLSAGSVPTWAWIAGAGIIAFTLLKKKKGGSDAKA